MIETLGILQARMGSTRLPGKVLADISGRPMLARQIERLRRCRMIDDLVVATTSQTEDDAIADLCEQLGVMIVRGDPEDVLDRFKVALDRHPCRTSVRLTGDCPLIDSDVVDLVIRSFFAAEVDYASNTIEPSWPDGLDVEVVRSETLMAAWAEAKLPSEREHVTPFIRKHPKRFKLLNVVADQDLSGLRWTVDDDKDLEFVRRVYDRLHHANPNFKTAEVLGLLRADPDLARLNEGTARNEGYAKSLLRDAAVVSKKN